MEIEKYILIAKCRYCDQVIVFSDCHMTKCSCEAVYDIDQFPNVTYSEIEKEELEELGLTEKQKEIIVIHENNNSFLMVESGTFNISITLDIIENNIVVQPILNGTRFSEPFKKYIKDKSYVLERSFLNLSKGDVISFEYTNCKPIAFEATINKSSLASFSEYLEKKLIDRLTTPSFLPSSETVLVQCVENDIIIDTHNIFKYDKHISDGHFKIIKKGLFKIQLILSDINGYFEIESYVNNKLVNTYQGYSDDEIRIIQHNGFNEMILEQYSIVSLRFKNCKLNSFTAEILSV